MELPVRPNGGKVRCMEQHRKDLKGLNDAEAVDENSEDGVNEPDVDEEEGAATKPLPQPKKPSAREIAEHERRNLPRSTFQVGRDHRGH